MFRSITKHKFSTSSRAFGSSSRRLASTNSNATSTDNPSKDDKALQNNATEIQSKAKATTKTIAEKDAEMMRKLAGISGEGGEAGIEYEDGKPVAMKRGVKNNMFRLI